MDLRSMTSWRSSTVPAPTSKGHIVLDQRATPASKVGDEWLSAAAERLEAMQQDDRVVLETTSKPVTNATAVLGYYSWGSTDPQHRVRTSKIGFVPGAIAATFVSSDARTFREPPANWVPDGNAANGPIYRRFSTRVGR